MDLAAATLETQRLILRPVQLRDSLGYYLLYSNKEAMKYLNGPWSRQRSDDSVASNVDRWQRYGIATWMVDLKTNGTVVPNIGLLGYGTPNEGVTGFGWLFHPRFQARGFAKEASIAAIDYCFDKFGNQYVIETVTDPGNDPSKGLSQTLGLRFSEIRLESVEVEGEIKQKDQYVCTIDAEHWAEHRRTKLSAYPHATSHALTLENGVSR